MGTKLLPYTPRFPHEGFTAQRLFEPGSGALSRIREALVAFQPDIVFLSAGFDAHEQDLCGLGQLTAADFRTLTTRLIDASKVSRHTKVNI